MDVNLLFLNHGIELTKVNAIVGSVLLPAYPVLSLFCIGLYTPAPSLVVFKMESRQELDNAVELKFQILASPRSSKQVVHYLHIGCHTLLFH